MTKRFKIITTLSALAFFSLAFIGLVSPNRLEELPIFIKQLRKRAYPASNLIIEETLVSGTNYERHIASYHSDDLKIYGLLTIPNLPEPSNGFPTIIFLHGYVLPQTYTPTNNYVDSQDNLAKNGFITFKPDFRGHGKSQGITTNAHFSENYLFDTLNALSALKIYPGVDSNRIGVWGHSNGGKIGLRAMVVSKEIKAGVFWAGVVGSFEDMLETYNSRILYIKKQTPNLLTKFGSPNVNPDFWNQLDPYSYFDDISGPIQLHHGTADNKVPVELSIHLKEALEEKGKVVELYQYEGANHNFSGNSFTSAMKRTVAFFNKHLQ